MAQWGNTDDAANSVLWGPATVNLPANTANRDNLFNNTTSDAFVTGQTVGVYGVSADEAQVSGLGVHTGWVKVTEGSGGRSGRVQAEVLVAMKAISGDSAANDDPVFPDA